MLILYILVTMNLCTQMNKKRLTPVSCLIVGLTWVASSGAVGSTLPAHGAPSGCWENNQVVLLFIATVSSAKRRPTPPPHVGKNSQIILYF